MNGTAVRVQDLSLGALSRKKTSTSPLRYHRLPNVSKLPVRVPAGPQHQRHTNVVIEYKSKSLLFLLTMSMVLAVKTNLPVPIHFFPLQIRLVSNPLFDGPIQILAHMPRKVRRNHARLFRFAILRGLGVALGGNARPFRHAVQQVLRPLVHQVFVLQHPHIRHALVRRHGEEIANLVGPQFEQIGVRFTRSVIAHFVKGLMFAVTNGVIVIGMWQGFNVATDDIAVQKVLLTATFRGVLRAIGPEIRADTFRGPWFGQECLPAIVCFRFQVRGAVVRNVFHGLEPIVRISKLRQDKCIVWVSCGIVVLKPMLVSYEFLLYRESVAETLGHVAGEKGRKSEPVCERILQM